MTNILSETILGNWVDVTLKANIDEKIDDVKLAIKYSDHGDEFLLVRTNDGKTYEYGWWLNRPMAPNYDELDRPYWSNFFIRKPKLFYAYDERSSLSNEISFYVNRKFKNDYGFMRPKRDTEIYAQVKFDEYIKFMNDIYSRGITYHKEGDKKFIEQYLKDNGILTEENLDKLHSVKFTTSVNGIDGIAGKTVWDDYWCDDRLHGDIIEFIFYKGKLRDISKIRMKYHYDEWGAEMFDLSLRQFK